MEEEFRMRPYSKRDLAKLYFPDTKRDNSAVANLRNMMTRCMPLMTELRSAAYHSRCRRLSTRQVRLIVKYLGEP